MLRIRSLRATSVQIGDTASVTYDLLFDVPGFGTSRLGI